MLSIAAMANDTYTLNAPSSQNPALLTFGSWSGLYVGVSGGYGFDYSSQKDTRLVRKTLIVTRLLTETIGKMEV